MAAVIDVKDVGKLYRLGQVGTGTLSHDLKRWWAGVQGKEDPNAKVGTVNDRTKFAERDEYVWALQDISFKINQGDIVGIIGKNGAGKSTLLKILSRITAPSTGNIKIKGRVGSLLEVGTGFHPEMTGRENVYMNGTVLGMRRHEIERKFDEIIDFAGVAKYVDTPVKRYSSGMMVRLGFAVAAFLEPEILIVDEVLAVGDSEFQKRAIGRMQDISKGEGRTVLFVSHNMTAINSLCKTGMLLEKGMVKNYSMIDECVKVYLNTNAAQSKINLAERTDRSGNGFFQFTEVTLLNKDMNPQNEFLSGDELNIAMKYKTINNETLNNVSVAMAINNSFDTQLAVIANYISNSSFKTLPPDGTILCKIPKLPLVSGTYSFNLFSRVNEEISDWIINTCVLNIETGDYYKTGKNTDSLQSLFLMDYNFSFNR